MTGSNHTIETTHHAPRVDPPMMLGMGEVGAGKSRLISTLAEIDNPPTVFVIITEPTGLETLLDVWSDKKLPIQNLHYKVITPARIGFEGLRNVAQKVSLGTFESLAKLPPSGDRSSGQWLQIIETLFNFKCDRTGETFGAVDTFNDARALVIDSLSGLNVMAMDLTIGDKSSAHQGEWGVAMGLLDKLLINLTGNLRCPFYLTAHLEPEADDLTGARKLMASTLGKKLAPRIPRFFSEVFALKRTSDGWFMDTKDPSIALKTRSLPVSDKLPPTLAPILTAYRKRKEFAASGKGTANE